MRGKVNLAVEDYGGGGCGGNLPPIDPPSSWFNNWSDEEGDNSGMNNNDGGGIKKGKDKLVSLLSATVCVPKLVDYGSDSLNLGSDGEQSSIFKKLKSFLSKKHRNTKQFPPILSITSTSDILQPKLLNETLCNSILFNSTDGLNSRSSVEKLAEKINDYYLSNGYPFCRVLEIKLQSKKCHVGERKSSSLFLSVYEPTVCDPPLVVRFRREMVELGSGGGEKPEVITVSEFKKRKLEEENERKFKSVTSFSGEGGGGIYHTKNMRTVYLPTSSGKTNARKLAKAMALTPGHVLKWDKNKWNKIKSSSLFDVVSCNPILNDNGTISLVLEGCEKKCNHIEYGVTKSLYSKSWEGEMKLLVRNLFGGDEFGSVTAKRGMSDTQPSVRIGYGDEKFGDFGGWRVEGFNEYIGGGSMDVDARKRTWKSVGKEFVRFTKKISSFGDASVNGQEEVKLGARAMATSPKDSSKYFVCCT